MVTSASGCGSAILAAYQSPPDFEIALYASTPQDYARLVAELT